MAERQRKEGPSGGKASKIFGAQVRLERVKKGLDSQQSLAAAMGFATHGTIAQIEMGNVAANFDVACELAVFLGISLDAIIGLAPPADAAPREWYSDTLILRLPDKVQACWPPSAQQDILIGTLEAMVRLMRTTRHAPSEPRPPRPPAPDKTLDAL